MKQLLLTYTCRALSQSCYPPPPPTGAHWATLGTAMNNFYSSPKKVITNYIIWLFYFWIWRRRCLKFAWFWPLGALPQQRRIQDLWKGGGGAGNPNSSMPRPKITKIGQKNKNWPKKGGPRPIRPPWIRHCSGPPWGPHVHVPYEQLWIPSPKGWFLPSLVTIRPCVFKK